MPDWVEKTEQFCDPECEDPCMLDCCCEFIGFSVCSVLIPCSEPGACKPGNCNAWNRVNLFWKEPPRCVKERAAAYGGENDFRYEIYFGECGELPDRIISSPVSGSGESCQGGSSSVSRCELFGGDGGDCGKCIPPTFCLLVRATTGEEIARCKACIDLCDIPCSSSSGSSGSGDGSDTGGSSSSSSGSSTSYVPPGDGPSSSSGSGGGSSSSGSSSSSSGGGYEPPVDPPSSSQSSSSADSSSTGSSSSSSGSGGDVIIIIP